MVSIKGRHTIRANTPSGREPRLVEPWTLTPKEGTTLAWLEAAYLDALSAVDAVEARKATAEKSGTLTASGVLSDTLQFAASTLAPKLKKARNAVERARAEASDRRAKLTLKKSDPSDSAGQVRRLWKLDQLRKMSDSERNAYIAKAGDSLDPELRQAILEVPEFSGLLPSDIELLHKRALVEQHGEEALTGLADLEAGIKIADDVIAKAREEVAFEVGGTRKFDEAAKPYEKLLGAAWLRKFSANGVEEVRSFHVDGRTGRTGTWLPATPEELENGAFFKDGTEWQAAAQGVVLHSMKEHVNGG
jgi:hypothetical protein